MIRNSAFLLLAMATLLLVSSCASSKPDPTRDGRERHSTVPWNKPERWEGQGALGGMMQ